MRALSRRVIREFWCPLRETCVTAEFDEEIFGGHRVEVAWCTALEPRTGVSCDKLCLRLRKLPRSTWRP